MDRKIDLIKILDLYNYSYHKAKDKAIEEMKKNNYNTKEISIVSSIIEGYFASKIEEETRGKIYKRQAMYQNANYLL